MPLIIILAIVLLIALLFGGTQQANYGPWGWSPAGVILLIVLLLVLTGNLHL